jgi:hypothetical protein
MKQISLHCAVALALLIAGGSVSAQTIIPPCGSPLLNAPLPPPLPEPKIAPPVVPKMDAPLQQNYAPLSTRLSFSDRITGCLQEGAAAGLGPSDREAYSRSCANR